MMIIFKVDKKQKKFKVKVKINFKIDNLKANRLKTKEN